MSPLPSGVPPKPSERCCPVCQEAMILESHPLPGRRYLKSDVCRPHGRFFDLGELGLLDQAARSEVRRGRFSRRSEAYQSGIARADLLASLFHHLLDFIRSRFRSESETAEIQVTVPGPLPKRQEKVRFCPDCQQSMLKEQRPDYFGDGETVTVDVCEEHGLWLDQGELDLILARSKRDMAREEGRSLRRAFRDGQEEGRERRRDFDLG